MINVLIVYSGVITMLSAAIWFQNRNLFKEIKSEQKHSAKLRETILDYLKGK